MKTVIYISIVLLVTGIQGCKQEADSMDSKNEPMDSGQSITPSFQKGYSDVNGIKMYYEIYGDGKPLALIHGGGSTTVGFTARCSSASARVDARRSIRC
jgi:hypothetical protein